MGIQTFDTRQPVALDEAAQIKPGDWLEDLGTLRQVDYTDTIGVKLGGSVFTIVHFKPQDGLRHTTLGIRGGKPLTAWREVSDDAQA